jgi:hypothetical protein
MSLNTTSLLRLSALLVIIFCFALLLRGQQSNVRCQRNEESPRAPRYRIGQRYRTAAGLPTLVVNISINPRHFNRAEMEALAHRLNQDFNDEQRLGVGIFDNYRAARRFTAAYVSNTFEQDLTSLRGTYQLDRTTGDEYIEFSPNINRPQDKVRINLSSNMPQHR